MRARIALLTVVSLAAALVGSAHAEAPVATPSAEAIFSAAKTAWRDRSDVPFVAFNLRERYEWRGREHDNWWHAAYRERDRSLAMRRIVVAQDERERLRGTPIGLNLHWHHGKALADSLDTNPNADAFPILEPQIEPDASFGLRKRDPKAALVGRATARPETSLRDPNAAGLEGPAASPTPSPEAVTPNAQPTEKPLREVARVEAVSRDYAIALDGNERVRGSNTYHLALTPLRDPRVYRLRDLWVDDSTFATVQLTVDGMFEGKPYDGARWTVGFTSVEGRTYVQQIRTDDTLRFGMDRYVTGLEFDFVAYEFPAEMPALTFDRFL